MRTYELGKNRKKKEAFTLIEVIVALGILAIIAMFVFPSLTNLFKHKNTNKDQARTIFAMEEAIETSKDKDISEFIYEVNGIEVEVTISDYQYNTDFKEIRAKCEGRELKLVVEK